MEPPVIPGKIVALMLEERGWTQSDLAKIIKRPQNTISLIITGRKAITPETAVSLALAFGNSPEFWIDLEGKYQVSLVSPDNEISERAKLYKIAPIKVMQKRGWIRKSNDPDELEEELKAFYRTEDLSNPLPFVANTKKTGRTDPHTPEQYAWIAQARNLAEQLRVEKFSLRKLKSGIKELHLAASHPENTRLVPRILADIGIRFVVIEPLPKTKIDGAAFWIDKNSPVVAISHRFDRIDSFWHSLGHELSHIKNQDGNMVDIEGAEPSGDRKKIEQRADEEAIEFVMNKGELEDFVLRVGPLYSRARINQFANRVKVHPGIIVGQLQHKGELSYSQLRDTLVRTRKFVTSEALTDGWGHFLS